MEKVITKILSSAEARSTLALDSLILVGDTPGTPWRD